MTWLQHLLGGNPEPEKLEYRRSFQKGGKNSKKREREILRLELLIRILKKTSLKTEHAQHTPVWVFQDHPKTPLTAWGALAG